MTAPALPPSSIYLVAGEESGDALGGALIRALRQRSTSELDLAGVGGRAMAAAGVMSPFPIEELSIVGVSAIPRRLPAILRKIRQTADAIVAKNPGALVIIDSPDFTHRVARRVRRYLPSIPIIDYVSPSVWAWRSGRARAMRAYVDHVLAILPFEPAVHERLGGPPCTYVGHPLIERLGDLRPNPDEAQRRRNNPPLVLVLPGSRTTEIRRLTAIFGAALGRVADRIGPMELVLPTLPHLSEEIRRASSGWTIKPRIVTAPADKWAAFRAARAALAASGTVTLELALAGVPTVAAYRISTFEEILSPPDPPQRPSHQRHSGEPRSWREYRARIHPASVHAGSAGAGACATVVRHAAAPQPSRGLRAARWDHGSRGRSTERQGRRYRAGLRPARPTLADGPICPTITPCILLIRT